MSTAQDSCASWSERAAAGERILRRGLELSGWLLLGGAGVKTVFGKAALADGVLTEAADEEIAIPASRIAHERAATLQALLGGSKGRVTMGAGVLEDASGMRYVVIGTSEPNGYLRPAVRAALHSGELIATGTSHAEQNIVNWATANGYRVIAVGAGRPVCPECAKVIENAGAIIASPQR